MKSEIVENHYKKQKGVLLQKRYEHKANKIVSKIDVLLKILQSE